MGIGSIPRGQTENQPVEHGFAILPAMESGNMGPGLVNG
jgi:hypothetical protein